MAKDQLANYLVVYRGTLTTGEILHGNGYFSLPKLNETGVERVKKELKKKIAEGGDQLSQPLLILNIIPLDGAD